MGYGQTLAGASAVGAVVGGAAGLRHAARIQEWKDQIGGADLAQLREGQPLPPIPEPPPITYRSQRGMVRCYVVGVLIGGFATWLVTFLVMLAITGIVDGSVGEKVAGALAFAFMAGLFGFVFPGLLIGAGIWLREVRGRLAHDGQDERRLYWESREVMRGRLARGEWSPEQAWRHITSGAMGTVSDAPPPLPGQQDFGAVVYPPEAGEPVEPLAVVALAAALSETTGGYRSVDHGANSTPAACARILTDPGDPAHQHAFLRLDHFNEGAEAQEWALTAAGRGDGWARRAAPHLGQERIDPYDHQAITMVASVIGAYRRARAVGAA